MGKKLYDVTFWVRGIPIYEHSKDEESIAYKHQVVFQEHLILRVTPKVITLIPKAYSCFELNRCSNINDVNNKVINTIITLYSLLFNHTTLDCTSMCTSF